MTLSKFHPVRSALIRWAFPLTLIGLSACRTLPPGPAPAEKAPEVRFLLTFDDGPSIRTGFNPTLAILDQLANNPVQPNISALFFVQTLHPRGGGTPAGRDIMRRMHQAGHVLGLHSISPEGHVAHHTLSDSELTMRLTDAKELLHSLTGANPLFVRPPFGAYTARTQAIYDTIGLNLLMCDLRARDGVIYGFNGSPRRRGHFRRSMARIRQRLEEAPDADGPHPILISFHDVNPYTARHMTEYLQIIVTAAQRAGLRLAEKPFFNTPEEVTQVGIRRRIPLPPPIDRYSLD